MNFRELPRPAKLLVVGVCLAGTASLAWRFYLPPLYDVTASVILVVLAFVVASQRVEIHPRVASMSLGFVLVLAALFRCGTMVGIAAAVVNVLGCHLFPGRGVRHPKLWVTSYNAASYALAALAAGLCFTRLAPHAAGEAGLGLRVLAAAVAVGAYYLVTILAIGLASTLTALRLPPRMWWAELLGIAPVYAAGGAAALALDAAVRGFGHWVFVVGLPFALLIQRSLATQAAKVDEEVRRLEERVTAGDKLAKLYLSMVQALSNAIEAKDHGTHLHVQRVQGLARAVARRVGLEGDELNAVEFGAVLHDIGKLAVPDRVLRKPGKLTDREFKIIQSHTVAGESILRPIDFGVDVATVVRHHHEKLDGTGYPDGLCGEEIPRGARVLAVIDVYDALVSDRPYRKAWTSEHAVAYLAEQAGASFDRAVVDALAEVLASGEVPDAIPSEGDELILPAVLDPEESDPAGGEPEGDTRQCIFAGLVSALAGRGDFQACVAYELDSRSGDLEAAAAAGPGAAHFDRRRLPVPGGPSGRAALSARPVMIGQAADDFACFADGVPEELLGSSATAFPLVASTGQVLAVLSFYLPPDSPFPPALSIEVAIAAAVAARQLEIAAGECSVAPAHHVPLVPASVA